MARGRSAGPLFKETALNRTPARRSVPVALRALARAALTVCAVDKGSALAANFEKSWAGTPDVAEIRTTKNNTLPFLGSSTGTLTVDEGTSADRVTQLAGELREYVVRRSKVTGRITANDITFTVAADEGRTGEVLALWRSLTADDKVKSADIHDAPWKEATVRWRIEATAVDAAGVLTAFKDMLVDGGRHRHLTGVTSLKVTGPGLFVETDFHDAFPAEAIAAYEAVLAQHSVTRATLRRDAVSNSAVTMIVADSADVAHAGELARSAAPNLGAAVEVRGSAGS
ncbi:hypothetical protein ACIBL6_14745 [Streptomyces sp. NPDC050400]|uniref:hypothetical protein n=1 Tax=Streptomyces sp. NPDC050400 TaxID=3365610 RepID=UPI0037BCED50